MSVHFPCTLDLSIGLLLCLPGTLDAADFSKLQIRGKAILQEKCGRCHAIEALGESPLNKAPPMRDIYARFNPRELQAEEGFQAQGNAAGRLFRRGCACDPCVPLCSHGHEMRSGHL